MINLIDERLAEYAGQHTTEEHPVLRELSRETRANFSKPQMLSGHQQGRFLALLVSLLNARNVLEIGTYTGYSAIAMALALPRGGKIHTIDSNDELEPVIRRYIKKAGVEDAVEVHIATASQAIGNLNNEWDMVFIDADKDNYSLYYDLVFDKVRSGGLIVADNVLWSGKVLNENGDKATEAIKKYNRKIQGDSKVENLLLPLRDGLMIARKF